MVVTPFSKAVNNDILLFNLMIILKRLVAFFTVFSLMN